MTEVRQEILDAHKASTRNREPISRSEKAGCFYCLAIFSPAEVEEYVLSARGGPQDDALCPKCGIDSVLASVSGYPITKEFLSEMHQYWFDQTVSLSA